MHLGALEGSSVGGGRKLEVLLGLWSLNYWGNVLVVGLDVVLLGRQVLLESIVSLMRMVMVKMVVGTVTRVTWEDVALHFSAERGRRQRYLQYTH